MAEFNKNRFKARSTRRIQENHPESGKQGGVSDEQLEHSETDALKGKKAVACKLASVSAISRTI